MKKNWKKRGITLTSILLLAVFFVTLLPIAAFAADNPQGTTIGTNNDKVDNNYGTITNNGSNGDPGEVGTNYYNIDANSYGSKVGTNAQGATISTNYGECDVTTNNGTIGTNYGNVGTNNGTITYNNAQSGTSAQTGGSIPPGDVDENNGNIGTNNANVDANTTTGTIGTNNGTIGTNDGNVRTNGRNGTIETNSATGTVTANEGTVVDNYGTVNNTRNGSVTNNYGGTVTGSNTDTVNNYYEVIAEGGTLSGTTSKNGTDWAAKGADATATFDGEAEIEEAGATIETEQNGSKWIYKLTNIIGKVKLVFKKGSDLDAQQENAWATWAAQIRAAAQGATLTFEAGIWPTIDKEVGRALADRTDVTVTFNTNFVEGGSVTIPAGTDVLGLIGNNGVITFSALAAAIK